MSNKICIPIISVIFVVFASSLLFGKEWEQPRIVYSDSSHPHSDTAVFAAAPVFEENFHHGEHGRGTMIVLVDGTKMNWWKHGYPFWVRVLPRDHRFTVQVSYIKCINPHVGNVEVSVPDMRPRHVYEV